MRNVSLDRQNTIVAMSHNFVLPNLTNRLLRSTSFNTNTNSLKFSTKRPRLFTQTDQAAWCSGHVPHFWEVRALNLRRDRDHPDWGLLWLFSVRLDNCRANASVRAQLLARYEIFTALYRRIQIFFPKFTPIHHRSPIILPLLLNVGTNVLSYTV